MNRIPLMATISILLTTGVAMGPAGDPSAASASATATPQPQQVTKPQATGPENAAPVPPGEMALATVRIPRKVTADGKPLPAGTYNVRLTADEAPKATGATSSYERWVEFLQGGQVKGREIASIVPAADADRVVKGRAPAPGRSKVEMLRGGYFWRVWINKAGNHFLIHLPPA